MLFRASLICYLCSGILSLIWSPASAHPGNTDSQSGHTNRKTGEYHFHTDTNQAVPKVSIQEKHWQKAFNDKVLHGELEYYVEGKRVDILTDHKSTSGYLGASVSGRVYQVGT
jgi:hypothetical protein